MLGGRGVHPASAFRRESMFQASFHSVVTSRMSWYAPPDTAGIRFVTSCLRISAINRRCRPNLMVCTFLRGSLFYLLCTRWGRGSAPPKTFLIFEYYQLSRERSKKTEAVFLVGSRESEGKSKSPPNREFSSRFGKEEMSTEDKRRRLRRLVPPWSFLTRQRFLLEKQKKMLKGSHKPVQSISLLIDFRFPLLQSKFLPSIPSVSLRLTAPLAARGAGGFFFPL